MKMDKTSDHIQRIMGLTLIELMIVIAIIGILAVLLLPSALTAIQKTKQKATMKEIMAIATATADYITDNGLAPPSGNGDINTAFTEAIVPFYMKTILSFDQWNSLYQVYTGDGVESAEWIGDSASDVGEDDFMIASFGRDKVYSGYTYDTSAPDSGLFIVDELRDFARDLVMWNAKWISAPSTAGK